MPQTLLKTITTDVSFGTNLVRFGLNLFKYTITIILLLLVLATIIPLLPIKNNIEPLVVLSGSMNPAIRAGSVVIIRPQDEYTVGQAVTFSLPQNPDQTVTHRLHEKIEQEGVAAYRTKGDANEDPDNWTISTRAIKGRVLFSLPLLGYLINFAKTPKGFIFLVIAPALLIMFDEMRTIRAELRKS